MIRLTSTSSEELAMPIDIDPLLMQQLLETFRIQLEERVQIITDGLLNLEKGGSSDEKKNTLDEMFRAAHNIKGASRGIGLENTATLSHHLENIFTALKRDSISLQKNIVNVCLLGLDTLRDLIDIEGQGNQPGNDFDELLKQLQLAVEGNLPDLKPEQAKPEKQVSTVDEVEPTTEEQIPASNITSSTSTADSIRLPVQRLDRIASLANELQVTQLRIEQHHADGRKVSELSKQLRRYWSKMISSNIKADRWFFSEGADLVLELESLCQNIDTSLRTTHSLLKPLTTKLRDDVHELRLVPAETILTPLKRVVRDIASTENKQVELILEGGQLEMDRVVLEKIRDPLIHLLRNAVDHGIEPPSERVKIGKNEIGQIKISLARDGNNVNLSIKDDGSGINLKAIQNKVIELELASEDELNTMSQAELADFIFRPGFSSRQNISETSGRGVGLDVVRSNIQMLKGRVSVSYTEQQGSLFLLTIPFTMSSEYGLFIRCCDQKFVIPAPSIKRILEITSADIINLESKQAILLDGNPVVLQSLPELLQLHEEITPIDDIYHVIVIQSGWQQIALIVSGIIGEQEMVIKSLNPPLNHLANFSGGTLGNDGNIILVLDIDDLLGKATNNSAIPSLSDNNSAVQDHKVEKILVVDDSITTRTLEVSILERQGYQVRAVVNAEDAIEILQTEKFDLLITDVEMPGMNGFELTHQVRTQLGLEKLPIIIVTSLASEEDRRRGLEVKADAYIVKSDFESKELLKTVAQLI